MTWRLSNSLALLTARAAGRACARARRSRCRARGVSRCCDARGAAICDGGGWPARPDIAERGWPHVRPVRRSVREHAGAVRAPRRVRLRRLRLTAARYAATCWTALSKPARRRSAATIKTAWSASSSPYAASGAWRDRTVAQGSSLLAGRLAERRRRARLRTPDAASGPAATAKPVSSARAAAARRRPMTSLAPAKSTRATRYTRARRLPNGARRRPCHCRRRRQPSRRPSRRPSLPKASQSSLLLLPPSRPRPPSRWSPRR